MEQTISLNLTKKSVEKFSEVFNNLEILDTKDIDILITQNNIDKTKINEDTIKNITSSAIYVGNLKAINNKKLKFQRDIEKDYDSLFRLVNIPNINKLIQEVNQEKEVKQKIFLLGSFINKIKSALK